MKNEETENRALSDKELNAVSGGITLTQIREFVGTIYANRHKEEMVTLMGAQWEDLTADSLDVVDIVSSVEDVFKVALPVTAKPKVLTLGMLSQEIYKKITD